MNLAALKGPGEVEAEVLMLRTSYRGSFLIVEGEADDRFFRPRIDPARCEIVNAGGKPTVVGAIDRLDASGFAGALGVVDDDCDSLDGRYVIRENIIPIDETRDLDALLFWSGALDRVLAEYANARRLLELGGTSSVRGQVADLALPFGELRRWSYTSSPQLDFANLNPGRFITRAWDFDRAALYTAAAGQVSLTVAELLRRVGSLPRARHCLICQGHDLMSILGLGLAKGGALGVHGTVHAKLNEALRLAFDPRVWHATKLAAGVRGWETNNKPYRVLAC